MESKNADLFDKQELEDFFKPIIIGYDGLDTQNHMIDLSDFGKSCHGISKTMATVAHYITTGNYNKKNKKLSCRVIATTSRENCYSFTGLIDVIDKSPFLTLCYGTVVAALFLKTCDAFPIFFKYIWKKAIKKPISEAELEKEIKDQSFKPENITQEDLNRTIFVLDKISQELHSSLKDSVKPIGHTCNTLSFGNSKKRYFLTINEDDKATIMGEEIEITSENSYKVLISEYDMKQSTCKISLIDDLYKRFKAIIVDSQAEFPNNPYSNAMNEQRIVNVKAKQKIQRDTVIEFIITGIVLR